jgi:hypothetical protein
MHETMYPRCSKCGEGVLLPVNLGKGGERTIKYRCTNLRCNARFDEHGYEIFDPEKQIWVRLP